MLSSQLDGKQPWVTPSLKTAGCRGWRWLSVRALLGLRVTAGAARGLPAPGCRPLQPTYLTSLTFHHSEGGWHVRFQTRATGSHFQLSGSYHPLPPTPQAQASCWGPLTPRFLVAKQAAFSRSGTAFSQARKGGCERVKSPRLGIPRACAQVAGRAQTVVGASPGGLRVRGAWRGREQSPRMRTKGAQDPWGSQLQFRVSKIRRCQRLSPSPKCL